VEQRIQIKAMKGRSILRNYCDREGNSPAEKFPQRTEKKVAPELPG